MKKLKSCLLICGCVSVLFPAYSAYGGPYTDDLSKCIVESTTPGDRADFVKWMFAAASLHPAVKSIAAVSQEQLDAANRQTANLLMKLLTDSCRQVAVKAVKYEGKAAFENSFKVLGQVAAQELFASPEVAAGLTDLTKYIDGEKLKSALNIE
jgi:hypothetical protein